MGMQGAIGVQIQQLVKSHRSQIEKLVDEVLTREINAVVEERLEARNGAPHEPAQAPRTRSEPAMKACAGCGRTLELGKFERGRNRCRECRHRDREQRRAVDHDPSEPDRLAITAHELAKRVHRPTGALDGATLESWLVDEQLATRRAGRLEPTPHGLELAAAIA